MYLYATSARAGQAHPAKVTDWAVSLTQKINQISPVPTSLWVAAMSPAVGTLTWVSVVDDLGLIEATEEKLAADPGYSSLIEQGLELISSTEPVDQTLVQLVHADADAANVEARYATTVQATLAPGSLTAGVALGIDLAQRAKKITGRPTSFGVGVTGVYGAVMWVTLFETIEELQAAGEALSADTAFNTLLDTKGAGAYQPNVTQTVSRKIV